ncbi:MAG: tetratricopeptide repeat protein [Gammaproteobacteria bacterium]
MTMRTFIVHQKALIILVLVSLSTPSAADFGAGIAAYKRGDFEAASSEFSRLATAGDVRAQFAMGLMHYNGEGVEQGDAAAFEWYRKSAEKGYAKAQYNLALIFDKGRGVERDVATARL